MLNNFRHIEDEPDCTNPTDEDVWEDTLICNSDVPLRKVIFDNLVKKNEFKNTAMKIQLISDITEEVPENSTDFTSIKSTMNGKEPMTEAEFTYSVPFVAGRMYNIWWHTGIDFEDLNIDVSSLTDDSDSAIIFKFNYTLNR